jgi:hypothetical protein
MAKSRTPKTENVASGDPKPKWERCRWDAAYCARVEALGAQGKSAPEIRKGSAGN